MNKKLAEERTSSLPNDSSSVFPNIDKLGELSKLSFTKEERENLENGINALLSFAQKLEDIDAEGLPSSTFIDEPHNIMRKDESPLSFDIEQMLMNAPLRDEQFIIVPRVLE